jgi:hypothetical protein
MEGGNGPAGARRGCGRGWARRARPGGKGGADTGVSRKGKGVPVDENGTRGKSPGRMATGAPAGWRRDKSGKPGQGGACEGGVRPGEGGARAGGGGSASGRPGAGADAEQARRGRGRRRERRAHGRPGAGADAGARTGRARTWTRARAAGAQGRSGLRRRRAGGRGCRAGAHGEGRRRLGATEGIEREAAKAGGRIFDGPAGARGRACVGRVQRRAHGADEGRVQRRAHGGGVPSEQRSVVSERRGPERGHEVRGGGSEEGARRGRGGRAPSATCARARRESASKLGRAGRCGIGRGGDGRRRDRCASGVRPSRGRCGRHRFLRG